MGVKIFDGQPGRPIKILTKDASEREIELVGFGR